MLKGEGRLLRSNLVYIQKGMNLFDIKIKDAHQLQFDQSGALDASLVMYLAINDLMNLRSKHACIYLQHKY